MKELLKKTGKNTQVGISSPNPNYEQPIKCATGENTVRVKSPQLIDFASKTDTGYSFENDTLVYESSKRAYAGVQWDISESIKNNQGKKLYFSYESINVSNQVGSIAFLRLSFSDGTAASYNTLLNHNLEHISYTIPNDTSNINKAFFAIYSNNSSNNTDDYSVTIVKPQLQFGETALPYSEYGTPQEKELDLEGYNKINYDNNTKLDNYYYDGNGQKSYTTNNDYINQTIENIKPSTIYYLSFKTRYSTPTVRFCEFKSDGTFIQRTLITSKQTITTNSNTGYVVASIDKKENSYFEELQLSEGSTEKEYEAYWKLNVYEDGYFSRENGKWYLNNEWGNKDLDNTISFTSAGQNNTYFSNIITDYLSENNIPYSTHFKGINNTSGASDFATKGDNIIGFNRTQSIARLYIKSTNFNNSTELNDFLANNDVKIAYKLQTPSKTEITNPTLINQLEEIYKLMSYDGTTIIETECEEGNMPIIISASALKGE